jgi:hypothetical protein
LGTYQLVGGNNGLSGVTDSDYIGDPSQHTGLYAFDEIDALNLLTAPGYSATGRDIFLAGGNRVADLKPRVIESRIGRVESAVRPNPFVSPPAGQQEGPDVVGLMEALLNKLDTLSERPIEVSVATVPGRGHRQNGDTAGAAQMARSLDSWLCGISFWLFQCFFQCPPAKGLQINALFIGCLTVFHNF